MPVTSFRPKPHWSSTAEWLRTAATISCIFRAASCGRTTSVSRRWVSVRTVSSSSTVRSWALQPARSMSMLTTRSGAARARTAAKSAAFLMVPPAWWFAQSCGFSSRTRSHSARRVPPDEVVVWSSCPAWARGVMGKPSIVTGVQRRRDAGDRLVGRRGADPHGRQVVALRLARGPIDELLDPGGVCLRAAVCCVARVRAVVTGPNLLDLPGGSRARSDSRPWGATGR